MPESDVHVDIMERLDDKIGQRARHIVLDIAPEALQKYLEGSLHYGDGFQDDTGLKGQWCDISRKVGPLRRALWEGETLTRESPRTILMDLIGHCLMTIDMIDRAEIFEKVGVADTLARSTPPNDWA